MLAYNVHLAYQAGPITPDLSCVVGICQCITPCVDKAQRVSVMQSRFLDMVVSRPFQVVDGVASQTWHAAKP